ncbi:MAG: hypothetical protein ABW076_13335 [Candidatus Thiodiazotropha sp.]
MKRVLSLWMILALSICAPVKSEAGRTKNEHFTEEGDYEKFHMGDKDFRVYKGYFKGGAQSYYGHLQYAMFWALLPNFESYDKEKNYDLFVKQLGYGRRIWFKIHPSSVHRNSLYKLFEHGKISGFRNYSNRIGQYDEMKYGLEVYYSHKFDNDDYLYRPSGDQLEVYLRCSSEEMKLPSPGCEMLWDYTDKVFVEADFSIAYLPQWRDILKHIELILEGHKFTTQGEEHGVNDY